MNLLHLTIPIFLILSIILRIASSRTSCYDKLDFNEIAESNVTYFELPPYVSKNSKEADVFEGIVPELFKEVEKTCGVRFRLSNLVDSNTLRLMENNETAYLNLVEHIHRYV